MGPITSGTLNADGTSKGDPFPSNMDEVIKNGIGDIVMSFLRPDDVRDSK